MKVYQKEIINNVVSYIAKIYKESFNKYISQIALYGIISLLDFRSLKETGTLCTDMYYIAKEDGAIPQNLIKENNTEKYSAFKIKAYKNSKYVVSIKNPDLDYLKPSEIKILNDILSYISLNALSDTQIINIAKEEIISWQKSYKQKPESIINIEYEFPNIRSKPKEHMSVPELTFIQYIEHYKKSPENICYRNI